MPSPSTIKRSIVLVRSERKQSRLQIGAPQLKIHHPGEPFQRAARSRQGLQPLQRSNPAALGNRQKVRG
jgi:hypothetical protein